MSTPASSTSKSANPPSTPSLPGNKGKKAKTTTEMDTDSDEDNEIQKLKEHNLTLRNNLRNMEGQQSTIQAENIQLKQAMETLEAQIKELASAHTNSQKELRIAMEEAIKRNDDAIDNGQAQRLKDLGEHLKPNAPEPFSGKASDLRLFLTNMRSYFMYYPTNLRKNSEQVRFAAGRLTGNAAMWFEPYMNEFVNKGYDERGAHINKIFDSYDEFEQLLEQTFGSENEQREAERRIRQLRQTGSASDYMAKFQQLLPKVASKDPRAHIETFYEGLKSNVKDVLYEKDWPEDLNEFMQMAVRIDNRQYARREERRMEQGRTQTRGFQRNYRNNYAHNKPNSGKPRRHPDAMDIDAVHKKQDKREEKKCFNCGKPGHFSRACRAPRKKVTWKPTLEGKKEINAVNQETGNHASMSWTACYDDNCQTHQSNKNGAGWYPKEPRTTREVNAIQQKNEEKTTDFTKHYQSMVEEWDQLSYTQEKEKSPKQKILSKIDLSEAYHRSPIEETRQINMIRRTRSIDDTSSETTEESTWEEIAEEARRQNEEGHPANKRCNPYPFGEDELVLIHATSPTEALRTIGAVDIVTGDHEYLSPYHENHEIISWASCVYHTCETHLKEKAENRTFPIRRNNGARVLRPYTRKEMVYFTTYTRNQEEQTATLGIKLETPKLCINGREMKECHQNNCTIHQTEKMERYYEYRQIIQEWRQGDTILRTDEECLLMWHQQQNDLRRRIFGQERCNEILYGDCNNTKCAKHTLQKETTNKNIQALANHGFNFETRTGAPYELTEWYEYHRRQTKHYNKATDTVERQIDDIPVRTTYQAKN